MEYLSGVVERITYSNEQNGFSVIKIKCRGFAELVTVVGNLAAVNVGAVLRVKGQWKHDSKYGRQFSAEEYKETVPATLAGMEKYLGSGLIKGIGPVYARKIVNYFKEDTLRVIEESVEYLAKVDGIGPKRLEMVKKAWQEQKEIKNVMIFLQSNGVSTAFAVKIYKTYGNDSISIVRNNPYRLADDIWGIGFKTADKIARQLGFEKDSCERCRAGIIYVLNEFAGEGHCYAGREQLIAEAIRMLEQEEGLISSTLEELIGEGAVIEDEGNAIYLPPFFFSEAGTARKIKEILAGQKNLLCENIGAITKGLQNELGFSYDQIQLEAINSAAASKFMVLTGGPGTGKTTTILAIIHVLQRMGGKVLLAAPTGRAAKRMSEITGMEAKTIHRLLEYKPPGGYQKNAENPLGCDVLIVDEASMIDIILMYNLLKAVPSGAAIILVGDIDQLPSVGAGNVLRDIIDSGAVSVIELKRIFRQALGSAIIRNAHRINKGQMPIFKGGSNSDFFFIEEEDPEKIAETIKLLCTERLPRYYRVNPTRDIQVLCPMQRGVIGALNLNVLLQEGLNPGNNSIRHGGACFRRHDKVMQIKNNYDKNIFNGDIGIISNIDAENKTISINFEGNMVDYDTTEMDELVHAYATTVHKSQGSEFKIVVAPIAIQHYMMLQRNLLYTCVTRAKKVLVLIGTKKAMGIAVSNDRIRQRNTLLAKRLAAEQ